MGTIVMVCLVAYNVTSAQSTGSGSLVDLLLEDERALSAKPQLGSLPETVSIQIDDAQFASAGIRKLVGVYVTLYTDLPSSPAVDGLPAVFDQGVAGIAKYFQTPRERYLQFRQTAFLMQDKSRFERLGCIPPELPEFLHGFQWGEYIWLYEQPSEYYRRHLLLHEATHAFMHQVLGGSGPPWYAEGIAELLGTHRWEEGKLQLAAMPQHKQDVPYWGRIKTVKNEYDHKRGLMIRQVFRTDGRGHASEALYGWSWAAAAFLEGHPQFHDRFRQLRTQVGDSSPAFTASFEQSLLDDFRELNEQWQIFVVDIDYGYSFDRAAVRYQEGQPLPRKGKEVLVDVDRGWQSSGIRLEPGQTYQVTAKGRYQIADEPEIWWCEPDGVTIQYHGDHPLGMLLGKVRLDTPRPGLANLTRPSRIGRGRRLKPTSGGTLYFTINEHPASWSDNRGQVTVRIRQLDSSP